MSDQSVAEALRSDAHCVVIEAPAGTGKTHQAASYARDAVAGLKKGQRVLILAHTHAACDVFASRTADLTERLQVGTIDSLVSAIAKIYHRPLGLPADIHTWSIEFGPACYTELARRVRALLRGSPGIADALAERHPVVICDEHQDASSDQHGIVDALAQAGAKLRLFGDSMQSIFGTRVEHAIQRRQWQEILDAANERERLDTAHRWVNGSPALGAWVLQQRERLQAGEPVDLRGQWPVGLTVLRGDNQAPRYGGFQLNAVSRRPIDAILRNSPHLLVLTAHNATIFGLNAFWGWRMSIWEGYTRDAFSELLANCRRKSGNPIALGKAMCGFLEAVGKGFSATAFGNRLIQELEAGCSRRCRGKPAEIQTIARLILQEPNHVGVGAALDMVHQLMRISDSFADTRIDLRQEFSEARRIRVHPDIGQVLARTTHQRGGRSAQLPPQSITTIHKSKGLETKCALILPCDANNFADNEKSRCLLYVALSRSSEQLTLLVPQANASPLLRL